MSDPPKTGESEQLAQRNASHWMDVFANELDKESDRAAVILAASIVDSALTELLKNHLVANPASTDELFDSPNAPLTTFSAKIAICYRLGLISSKLCRDLNLIRKIRNEFAHNVHGCTFEDSRVRARVLELYRGTAQRVKESAHPLFPRGPRGDFCVVCSWILWALHSEVEGCVRLRGRELEFGYLEEDD